jgi:signal transduction histidine kinase/ActR/RegA family two-component response regulator
MSRRVLLVDDEDKFRSLLVRELSGEFEFTEAGSPDEAKRVLRAHPEIRVVVLDLAFAGNPLATSVITSVHDRAGDYRFIVLTAHADRLAAEDAEKHAVFIYLSKGNDFESIKFALDQAFKDLDRQHLNAKLRYLLDIQERIRTSQDSRKILDVICEAVQKIIGAYTCHIRVHDFARGDFPLGGFAGPKTLREAFDRPKVSGELFSGRVISTGEEEVIDDLQEMDEFREFARQSREARRKIPEAEQQYWQTVRSAYLVPIRTGVFGRRVDAVLNVSSDIRAFFTAERRALVQEFVTQACLAMAKGWLERKRSEIHDDYNEIGKMFNEMSELSDINDILEVVTSRIAKLISAEVVSVFLFNEETGVLENIAGYSGSDYLSAADLAKEAFRPGESFTGTVYSTEETIMRPDPRAMTQVRPIDDSLYQYEHVDTHIQAIPSGRLEHYLGVPLKIRGVTRGVLRAENKKSSYYDTNKARRGYAGVLLERGFSIDCLNALTITAGHLAVTIRNSELLKKRDERVAQVETLAAVGKIINQTLDMKEVLRLTIEQMAKVMSAQICMVFLKDEHDSDRIVLVACYGMPVIPASYKRGEGVAGRCYASGKPSLIPIAKLNDGKYDAVIREHLRPVDGTPAAVESLMVVPIIAKGVTLGVMKVVNRQGAHGPFTDSDFGLFQTFAEYVAVAIENAEIYRAANENAVLSLMVSVAAHEIGNTSGCIPANVAAIRDTLGTPPPGIEDMLATIEASATEATDFAKEISGFSPTRPDQKEEFDVNDLVDGIVHAFRHDLPRFKQSSKSTLKIRRSKEPLVCRVFQRPFEQTIRNIIINAFQALGDKADGYVRISMASEERDGARFATISIEDNGCGIDERDLPRIFDGGFTRKPRGSGVGLWLAQKHLALLGGAIDVTTELHKGSTFVVRLPLIGGESRR